MNNHTDLNDFNAVFKQYRDLVHLKVHQFARVHPLVARRIGAQDLFQEALIALWKATKTYKGYIPFHSYAAILIQRELLRYIRFRHYLRRERTIAEYPTLMLAHDHDPAHSLTISDLAERVIKVAKRALTRKQYLCLMKYLLIRRRFEVKEVKRIAKQVGCSVNAVRVMYYQAIQRLKLALNVRDEKKRPRQSLT